MPAGMVAWRDCEGAVMADYKYPYIPREYYPATMFACKLIHEHGTFNRAIEAAADYYNVDESTLAKHVRARQAAGQKGKKGVTAGKKLKWWFIPRYQNDPHEMCWEVAPIVKRGYSKKSIFNTLVRNSKTTIWSERFYSYGDAVGPYDTKEDAIKAGRQYMKEHHLRSDR